MQKQRRWWQPQAKMVDALRDPAYQLNHSATPLPFYQLENSGRLRNDARLFVSPFRTRLWLKALLSQYRFTEADKLFARVWYSFSRARYAALRSHYWDRRSAEIDTELNGLLREFAFAAADELAARSSAWITLEEYAKRKQPYLVEYATALIDGYLKEFAFAKADDAAVQFSVCITPEGYATRKLPYLIEYATALIDGYLKEFAFAKADDAAAQFSACLTPQEYAQRKLPYVVHYFGKRNHMLSNEQAAALVAPTRHLLVKARAGSGKTQTIGAKTAFLIEQEGIDPDQILLLAFNTKAAKELQERVQGKFGFRGFRTALTLHALARRLVNPVEKILGSDEEQNQFVGEVMNATWTPRLRLLAAEFFEATDDLELEAENAMDAETYLSYRWEALNHLSIGGHIVKSKGEKWIADLLFAHNVRFDYERVYLWNQRNYRPDFTIKAPVAPYKVLAILEHWGVGKNTPDSHRPFSGDVTAAQYRKGMADKRAYWQRKGIPLIETSVDDMRRGRDAFNAVLLAKLKYHSIEAVPIERAVLAEQVERRHWDALTQSMLQFVQRAKNKRKSPAEVARIGRELKDAVLRTRTFWELGAHVYGAYERRLNETGQIDFQDLLAHAAEKVERSNGNLSLVHKEDSPHSSDDAIALSQLRWLLIDEYQDFTPGFDHLVTTMRRYNPHLRLFCVGDDWQAINSFAGSEPIFFRDFVKRLAPNSAQEVLMRTNYRSHRAIVEVGNALMKGDGAPSQAKSTQEGNVYITEIDQIILPYQSNIANDEGDTFGADRSGEKKQYDNGFMGAKCLEVCARLTLPRLRMGKKVAILCRTNWLHNTSLKEFRAKLIRHLGHHWDKSYDRQLEVTTMHKSKGTEADLVILGDIAAWRMPLIHQDTRLYAPFLPQGTDPIAEARMDERRLFYVALTRAKETLWILTESGLESEFLNALRVQRIDATTIPPLPEHLIGSRKLPAPVQ